MCAIIDVFGLDMCIVGLALDDSAALATLAHAGTAASDPMARSNARHPCLPTAEIIVCPPLALRVRGRARTWRAHTQPRRPQTRASLRSANAGPVQLRRRAAPAASVRSTSQAEVPGRSRVWRARPCVHPAGVAIAEARSRARHAASPLDASGVAARARLDSARTAAATPAARPARAAKRRPCPRRPRAISRQPRPAPAEAQSADAR